MTTIATVLGIAARQVGYVEKNSATSGPGDGNWTKYAAEAFPAAQKQPWCATSEAWIFQTAGMKDMRDWIVSCWANCSEMERRARKNGMWVGRLSSAQVGDIVIFGTSRGVHTGLLEKKLGGGLIQTLEGNTSPSNRGSQNNGGGYYRRTRSMGWVRGFIRPMYQKPKLTDPQPWQLPTGHLIGPNPLGHATWHDGTGDDKVGHEMITQWQTQMAARGWVIAIDGEWGSECTKVLTAFQQEKGLENDGVLGPESWKAAWSTEVTA